MFWLALLAASPAPFHGWGRFSRDPALAHTSETVEVATDGKDGGMLQYRLRLTRARPSREPEVLWADSRTCEAVRPILASLTELPLPRFAPPLADGDLVLTMDGIGYSLHMPVSGYDAVDLASNTGTPLAAWVDGALAKLAPCWSAVEPRRR